MKVEVLVRVTEPGSYSTRDVVMSKVERVIAESDRIAREVASAIEDAVGESDRQLAAWRKAQRALEVVD